jgi:hypothetical protein
LKGEVAEEGQSPPQEDNLLPFLEVLFCLAALGERILKTLSGKGKK